MFCKIADVTTTIEVERGLDGNNPGRAFFVAYVEWKEDGWTKIRRAGASVEEPRAREIAAAWIARNLA